MNSNDAAYRCKWSDANDRSDLSWSKARFVFRCSKSPATTVEIGTSSSFSTVYSSENFTEEHLHFAIILLYTEKDS